MHLNKWRMYTPAVLSLIAGALTASSALAGGFTAEQATAGKTAYDSQCSQCHGRQLEGPDAPALAGPDIMQNWHTAAGLYDFISVAMPPSAPGLLGEEAYLNIVAYIMQFNGAEPGDTPMTADPDALEAISLVAETSGGAAPAATTTAPAETVVKVPQAYTWGKQLPGAPAPAAPAPAATPAPAPAAPAPTDTPAPAAAPAR